MEEEFNIIMEDTVQDITSEIQNDFVRVGSTDYRELEHKPQINNVTLIGNKSLDDLDIQVKGEYADTRITNIEIDSLF